MSSKCHRKLQEFAQIKVCGFFVSFSGAAVGPRVFCTSPDRSSRVLYVGKVFELLIIARDAELLDLH